MTTIIHSLRISNSHKAAATKKKYFIIQKWSLLELMGTKEDKFPIKM